MTEDSRRRSLDTKLMQEKLKGDSFPDNWNGFLDDDIRAFFDELLNQTGQKKSEIIRKANLSRTYGYQIMEGRRLGKRDYYLLISIAMSLDLKTTQRMLAVTHCGALHPLIKRDAAIIFAINHGYDNEETYEFMSTLKLAPLDDGSLK
ncbi:MAG: hypothetical protein GX684_02105 [Ruminococcaceae bacterium]|nr:hypothetical protein [Oscillospiraceae bacterium]